MSTTDTILIRATLAGYMAGCADHDTNPYADTRPEWLPWSIGYDQGARHRKQCGVVVSPPTVQPAPVEFIHAIRMVHDLHYLEAIEEIHRTICRAFHPSTKNRRAVQSGSGQSLKRE